MIKRREGINQGIIFPVILYGEHIVVYMSHDRLYIISAPFMYPHDFIKAIINKNNKVLCFHRINSRAYANEVLVSIAGENCLNTCGNLIIIIYFITPMP
jgi:hypothetical protein